MKNVSLALDINSIYLSYVNFNGYLFEIESIKKAREKIYNCDELAIKDTIEKAKKIKKSVNVKIDDDDFLQSQEESKKMYLKSKKYLLDGHKKNNKLPTAIIIGGQQGSGKTGIVLKSIMDFKAIDKDAVVLDLDAYRGFYKNYFKLILKYPESYSKITNPCVGEIMEKLTNEVIKQKYNFIFEGTLKSTYTLDLLLKSPIKYNIIVKVMGVSREESILSNFERYIEMKRKTGLGRLTKISEHDDRYFGLVDTIKRLKSIDVDIEVYERSKSSFLPVLIYKTSNKDNMYSDAYEALVAAREKSRIDCIKTSHIRLEKIIEDLKKIGDFEKLYSEIEQLKAIFNTKEK